MTGQTTSKRPFTTPANRRRARGLFLRAAAGHQMARVRRRPARNDNARRLGSGGIVLARPRKVLRCANSTRRSQNGTTMPRSTRSFTARSAEFVKAPSRRQARDRVRSHHPRAEQRRAGTRREFHLAPRAGDEHPLRLHREFGAAARAPASARRSRRASEAQGRVLQFLEAAEAHGRGAAARRCATSPRRRTTISSP